ncbi:MAG: hypothetical protein H7067_01370 [Burkholderiales bacterium]|nr:hypothetical protein [Opitutaceae bacterium]
MRFPLLVSLIPVLVFGSSLRVAAQGAPVSTETVSAVQIEVASVKFGSARADGGGDYWMESIIELNVKPGGRQVSGEFLNRVRVTLNLGCTLGGAGAEKTYSFYKASGEMIAVEGGKAFVRFYLPPEVVKRDKLRGDPEFYLVELEVAGESQKITLNNTSKGINAAETLASFKGKISSEAAANEGVLMPQYLTPFASDSRRPSPTFLRREAQR